jgi:hypothetical protein
MAKYEKLENTLIKNCETNEFFFEETELCMNSYNKDYICRYFKWDNNKIFFSLFTKEATPVNFQEKQLLCLEFVNKTLKEVYPTKHINTLIKQDRKIVGGKNSAYGFSFKVELLD